MDTSYRRFGNAASAIRLTTLVLALWSAWAKPAAAAALFWDINGAAPGIGGTGAWNTTNAFWNTSAPAAAARRRSGTTGRSTTPSSRRERAPRR